MKNKKVFKNLKAEDIIEQNRKFRCVKCGDVINGDLNVLYRDIDGLEVAVWCDNCIKTIDKSEPYCGYRTISKEEYIQDIIDRHKHALLRKFSDNIEEQLATLHYYEDIEKTEIFETMFNATMRFLDGFSTHRTRTKLPKSKGE